MGFRLPRTAALLLSPITVWVAASCGSTEPARDAGPDAFECEGTAPSCVVLRGSCCGDSFFAATCSGGEWACDPCVLGESLCSPDVRTGWMRDCTKYVRDAGRMGIPVDEYCDERMPPDAAAVAEVLCESTDDAAACVVQSPSEASRCDGRGGVVFDGATCVLAAGTECGSETGAFDSFEQCATACAASGACDRSKLRNLVLSCDRLWTCTRGSPAEDQLCAFAEDWSCHEPGPDPPDCVEGRRCWKIDVAEITPELEERLCALSLMPTVLQVRCFNWR